MKILIRILVVIGGLFAALFVLVLIVAFFGGDSGSSSNDASTATAPASQARASSPEPAPPSWQKVGEWSGSGAKNTELLDISGRQWRIKWTAEDTSGFGGGLIQVYVYKEGQELPSEIPINTQVKGKMSDTTFVQARGTFRMQCNCANVSWTMLVEQETR